MRFVKFALVGMGNTAIAFAVFNVLVRWPGLPALVASGLAWVAGFGNSFVWNRSWTFADRGRLPFGRVLSRFLASNLVALAADETVVAVLTRTYGHSLHGVSLTLLSFRQSRQPCVSITSYRRAGSFVSRCHLQGLTIRAVDRVRVRRAERPALPWSVAADRRSRCFVLCSPMPSPRSSRES